VGLYTQLVTTHASFLQRRKSDAAKATLASFSRRRQNDVPKATLASFSQRRENDTIETTLASFKLVTQNDARLTYMYYGFRHLRLVPRVLRYSTGFYDTAVTLDIISFIRKSSKMENIIMIECSYQDGTVLLLLIIFKGKNL
jgi:hypothetical protein